MKIINCEQSKDILGTFQHVLTFAINGNTSDLGKGKDQDAVENIHEFMSS